MVFSKQRKTFEFAEKTQHKICQCLDLWFATMETNKPELIERFKILQESESEVTKNVITLSEIQ